MPKRSLLVLGLVGCMSTFASGQIFVEYWPMDESPNGVNDSIEMDNSGGDVTRRLYIGLTGGDGSLLTAGMDFDFDWPAGVELTNFEWRIDPRPPAPPLDPPGLPGLTGVHSNTLPSPYYSNFTAPPFPDGYGLIPTGPDPQLTVASVDLTVSASVALGNYSIRVGSFSDPSSPTVNDSFIFDEYDIDPGSSSIPFNVTPEPSTMALLAFGGFAALRRRTSL